MKKLVSCLLAAVMLFTAVSAFAGRFEPIERNNIITKFVNETDLNTKDIAVQVQFGDKVADIVLRAEPNSVHMVGRENGTEVGHIQLTPKAVYTVSNGEVSQLQYATLTSFLQDMVKDLGEAVNAAIDAIPAQPMTEAELEAAVEEAVAEGAAAAAQADADAVTLLSASADFASKFKPEYILDVKDNGGSVEISLRSDAFATAFDEAVDSLMMNPAMAELVDRQAAVTGGKTFAEMQKDWLVNRDAALEQIRTIQSTDTIDEDGHCKSHFQIGQEVEGAENNQVLVCDTDTWINAEDAAAEIVFSIGFKDAEPFAVYEMAVNQDSFWEKLNSMGSVAEIRYDFEDGRPSEGFVSINVMDKGEFYAEFGQDYLYAKGPKGCVSASILETWTGKVRCELYVETAEGKENSLVVDVYEDEDSLTCEVKVNDAEDSLKLKLSRIDRIEIEDLTASENITDITEDMLKAEVAKFLMTLVPTVTAAPEADK